MEESKKKCYENDSNLQNFHKLYKVRTNIIEMFSKMDYDVSEYTNFSSAELSNMLMYEQLDMILRNEKTDLKVYIKFYEFGQNKVLNKNSIDNMVEDLFKIEKLLNNNDTLVIINSCDPNDSCKQHLRLIWDKDKYLVTVIDVKRLLFNILNHESVPKHTILGKEEEELLRKKYNIKDDSNIPEISRFDPVAQIIGMKPGNICKILRPSKNAIESEYFRLCINK